MAKKEKRRHQTHDVIEGEVSGAAEEVEDDGEDDDEDEVDQWRRWTGGQRTKKNAKLVEANRRRVVEAVGGVQQETLKARRLTGCS